MNGLSFSCVGLQCGRAACVLALCAGPAGSPHSLGLAVLPDAPALALPDRVDCSPWSASSRRSWYLLLQQPGGSSLAGARRWYRLDRCAGGPRMNVGDLRRRLMVCCDEL